MPNAKVLESKKAIVDALTEKLQNSTSAVFVDYKGITVAQDTELRHKFREAGVEYTVVKNTLTRFAANKAGYNQFDELLNGHFHGLHHRRPHRSGSYRMRICQEEQEHRQAEGRLRRRLCHERRAASGLR